MDRPTNLAKVHFKLAFPGSQEHDRHAVPTQSIIVVPATDYPSFIRLAFLYGVNDYRKNLPLIFFLK